jgi:outer membrane protein
MNKAHISARIGVSLALASTVVLLAAAPVLSDEPSRPDFPVVVPQPAPEPVAPPPPIEEPKENAMHWGIGLGAGYRPDYEGSDHFKPFPIGFVRLWWDDGRRVELRGTESSGSAVRISSNLIPNSDFELGPVLQYRLPRDEVKSGRVDHMKDIDGAVEAGVYVGFAPRPWRIGATYTYDVSNEYGGSLVELVAGWSDKLTDLFDMGVSVASTYASGAYMGKYFGVSPVEAARTGFDAYDADQGFKDVGGRVTFGIGGEQWDGWKIFASASYFRLLGDAEDSPVVDDAGDANQYFGGIGVAYEH